MRAFSTFASLFALSSLLVLPGLAHAQSTCTADSDCVKGWTCQVSGGSGCASPACPPGDKCDAQPSDCTPTEFKSCQPAPCQADSDCADGMVCYTYETGGGCAAIACAPGQTCPDPVCDEPKTESACVPRYVPPCTTAADCGAGFTCEASEECACSGGAPSSDSGSGSGASAGGASTPTVDPNCTCEPSKQKSCHADLVNCTADSDCTAGWTCAVTSASSGCANSAPEPAPGAGAQGGASPAPVPDCQPSAEIKQCVPPYYTLVGGVRGATHDSSGGATLGEGAPGAVIPPTGSDADDKGTTNGATDNTNNGDSSSAGCAVSQGARSTGSALALFGMLGILSVLRRRRAH